VVDVEQIGRRTAQSRAGIDLLRRYERLSPRHNADPTGGFGLNDTGCPDFDHDPVRLRF
jgi:hypothetical protein